MRALRSSYLDCLSLRAVSKPAPASARSELSWRCCSCKAISARCFSRATRMRKSSESFSERAANSSTVPLRLSRSSKTLPAADSLLTIFPDSIHNFIQLFDHRNRAVHRRVKLEQIFAFKLLCFAVIPLRLRLLPLDPQLLCNGAQPA